MGIFKKINFGLRKTRNNVSGAIDNVLDSYTSIDQELFDEQIDESKPLTITHPIDTWKKITFTNYEIKTLTTQIISKGKVVYSMPKLKEIANYARSEMLTFWAEYLRIDSPHIYKVDLSDKLLALKTEMLSNVKKGTVKNERS